MAYKNFKELVKRKASDKVWRDKAFSNVKNSKYDGYQRELACMVSKFFDKKSAGIGVITLENNGQLAEELHKPIIRNLNKKQFILHSKTIFGLLI